MRALTARWLAAAQAFEPRRLPLAIARSVLAAVELASLVLAPDRVLFVYEPGLPDGMRCAGPRGLSMWCLLGPDSGALLASRIVAIVVLAAVVVGYRPRWTCVPHWYVTFSLTASVTQAYGADTAATVATILLIPMLAGDDRAWHWVEPRHPLPPRWRGSAYAAMLAVRCQIAIIYSDAAISKLGVAQWRDGTAMYTVFVDPNYGLPLAARSTFALLLSSGIVVALITWGTVATELSIAVCALVGRRSGRLAVLLAILLHGGIMLTVGLVGFALTMIAIVLLLCLNDQSASHPIWRSDDTTDSPVRPAGSVRT